MDPVRLRKEPRFPRGLPARLPTLLPRGEVLLDELMTIAYASLCQSVFSGTVRQNENRTANEGMFSVPLGRIGHG